MKPRFKLNNIVLKAMHNTVTRWGFKANLHHVQLAIEQIYRIRMAHEEPVDMELLLLDLKEYFEFDQVVEDLRYRFPEEVIMDQESVDRLISLYSNQSIMV